MKGGEAVGTLEEGGIYLGLSLLAGSPKTNLFDFNPTGEPASRLFEATHILEIKRYVRAAFISLNKMHIFCCCFSTLLKVVQIYFKFF